MFDQARVGDGSSAVSAARSCATILLSCPYMESGSFWIDPDGSSGIAPFNVDCVFEVLKVHLMKAVFTQFNERMEKVGCCLHLCLQ